MPPADDGPEAIELTVPTREIDTPAHLLAHQRVLSDDTEDLQAMTSCFSCIPLRRSQRIPYAVGPGSVSWVSGDDVTRCSICEVEFGTQHKHVTRRHCRKCGGVFCYTCTYDKAALRTWPDLPWGGRAIKNVHVCTNCYDVCPPPGDGLRRCRFCHQRVRLPYFQAHHSVCLEEQYARAQFAPKQLQYFGGGASACGHSFHSTFASASSSLTPSPSSSSTPRFDAEAAPTDTSMPDSAVGGTVEPPASQTPPSSKIAFSASPLDDSPPSAERKKAMHPFAVAQAAAGERAVAEVGFHTKRTAVPSCLTALLPTRVPSLRHALLS